MRMRGTADVGRNMMMRDSKRHPTNNGDNKPVL